MSTHFKVEGYGRMRHYVVTHEIPIGKMPDHISIVGHRYERVRTCRMNLARPHVLRCSSCGRTYDANDAPTDGEFCKCGAVVAK